MRSLHCSVTCNAKCSLFVCLFVCCGTCASCGVVWLKIPKICLLAGPVVAHSCKSSFRSYQWYIQSTILMTTALMTSQGESFVVISGSWWLLGAKVGFGNLASLWLIDSACTVGQPTNIVWTYLKRHNHQAGGEILDFYSTHFPAILLHLNVLSTWWDLIQALAA